LTPFVTLVLALRLASHEASRVLIDWPEQKRLLSTELLKVIRSLSHTALVREVPALTLYEGKRAVLVYPDGVRQDLTMKSVESRATLRDEDLAIGGGEPLAQAITQLANGLGSQIEEDFFATMKKASRHHGGTFGGKTPDEIFNGLMAGLEEMDMTFEDDGTPSIFFVTHPDNIAAMQSINTPDRQAIVDEIIEGKRIEWLRREGYRRLVD
jgi:hypothetical protein